MRVGLGAKGGGDDSGKGHRGETSGGGSGCQWDGGTGGGGRGKGTTPGNMTPVNGVR
jgi:hypothetical protein